MTALLLLVLAAYAIGCAWSIGAIRARPGRRLPLTRRYHRAIGGESARGET